MTYERGEPVLLNYSEDDLYPEDLGASGIVLDSPFKDFLNRLNETFYYFGTIRENDEWCVISYRSSHEGKRLREYVILKSMIKKHIRFEKLGYEWVYKIAR